MNSIVYLEILSLNPKKTAEFFKSLFGWECHVPHAEHPDYISFKTGGERSMDGGIELRPSLPEEYSTLLYIGVDQIQAAFDQAVALGAKIKKPVTELGNDWGRIAIIEPPETAAIGLWSK